MKKLLIIFALAFITNGEALLPPLYEGIDEIKSILSNKELGEKLHSGEVILSIQKNDTGYLITTNYHTLQADVVRLPSQYPGPAHFKIVFHSPE